MPPTEANARLGPPDRWLACPRKGAIIADCFVPFKTPLCELYNEGVPDHQRFTPDMLLRSVENLGRGKIGLWIDLTNTDRFYHTTDITKHAIQYEKINCRGHGESPAVEATDQFIHLCASFKKEQPKALIGVHCTHGFNRTGFLISAYLIAAKDWDPTAAILTFAKTRPPGIYKEAYVKDLFTRYGGDLDDMPDVPAVPDWSANGAMPRDEDGDEGGDGQASTSEENGGDLPQFMDGNVPGVTYETNAAKRAQLQKITRKYCSYNGKGFPGSQPVSMDRADGGFNNMILMSKMPYKVSWKADGLRYMMLIEDKDQVYMFDRNHHPYKVDSLHFPHRKHDRHLRNTLLDGEMIIDESGGVKYPRYLIYDAVRIDDEPGKGMDIHNCDFNTRMACIRAEIIQPRIKHMEEGKLDRASETMGVRLKEFWDATRANVDKLLGESFAKNVSHEIDGLVFQPVPDPYTGGRNDHVLKWKPPHLNTVDFQLRIKHTAGVFGRLPEWQGELWVLHMDEPMFKIEVTRELKQYDNKIIECHFEGDLETGTWKFMRERTDKSHPNAYNTCQGVCRAIRYPITKKYLLDFIEHQSYQALRKRAAMPPPKVQPPGKKPKTGTA